MGVLTHFIDEMVDHVTIWFFIQKSKIQTDVIDKLLEALATGFHSELSSIICSGKSSETCLNKYR